MIEKEKTRVNSIVEFPNCSRRLVKSKTITNPSTLRVTGIGSVKPFSSSRLTHKVNLAPPIKSANDELASLAALN